MDNTRPTGNSIYFVKRKIRPTVSLLSLIVINYFVVPSKNIKRVTEWKGVSYTKIYEIRNPYTIDLYRK